MADWLALHGGDEFTRIFVIVLIEEMKRKFVHSKWKTQTVLHYIFDRYISRSERINNIKNNDNNKNLRQNFNRENEVHNCEGLERK